MSVMSMQNPLHLVHRWNSHITSSLTPVQTTPLGSEKIEQAIEREKICCTNCQVTKTPSWRTGPNGSKLCNRCGLYWLRHKAHRPHHTVDRVRVSKPQKTKKKDLPFLLDALVMQSEEEVSSSDLDSPLPPLKKEEDFSTVAVAEILLFDLRGVQQDEPSSDCETKNSTDDEKKSCSHCSTSDTPLWRKGPTGDRLCNRCGVYWRRHQHLRPLDNKERVVGRPKQAPLSIDTSVANKTLTTLTKSAYLVEERASSPGVEDSLLIRNSTLFFKLNAEFCLN
ncbi:suppressor of ferric uptake SFU1 [Acrasis kona]|uniref:Suppressor of ferric uptake SFU1 n=1 Tax=Acrasis kona TaxID=1008807 RepID=A0AAW2YK96_9EUKA